MIRLYALRCIACERPWCATRAALRRACPFCGGPCELADVVRQRAVRERLRRTSPQLVRARVTRVEFVERLLSEYMPEALR